jgi:hypothetical protein
VPGAAAIIIKDKERGQKDNLTASCDYKKVPGSNYSPENLHHVMIFDVAFDDKEIMN